MQGTNAAETITDGGSYGDDIYALAGNDLIIAARENAPEVIDGGDGIDTISYVNVPAVHVELQETGGSYYVQQTGDMLRSIENVIGSNYDDTLIGNSGVNELFGLAGNDFIEGGAGGDKIDGGAGYDTTSYGHANSGVQVYLDQGKATGGEASGDRLFSIENAIGSSHDDVLRGNAAKNSLVGGDGGDALFGFDGNDVLNGGDGKDTLVGGSGSDQQTGGAGADIFRFVKTADSYAMIGHQDRILDFNHSSGDKLDFGQIDAKLGQGGTQDFHFIGDAAFSAEGQIRAHASDGDIIVEVNTSGAAGAEMSIVVADIVSLSNGDFIL